MSITRRQALRGVLLSVVALSATMLAPDARAAAAGKGTLGELRKTMCRRDLREIFKEPLDAYVKEVEKNYKKTGRMFDAEKVQNDFLQRLEVILADQYTFID